MYIICTFNKMYSRESSKLAHLSTNRSSRTFASTTSWTAMQHMIDLNITFFADHLKVGLSMYTSATDSNMVEAVENSDICANRSAHCNLHLQTALELLPSVSYLAS